MSATKCNYCTIDFKTHANLVTHLRGHRDHVTSQQAALVASEELQSRSLTKSFCNECGRDVVDRAQHVSKHAARFRFCFVCNIWCYRKNKARHEKSRAHLARRLLELNAEQARAAFESGRRRIQQDIDEVNRQLRTADDDDGEPVGSDDDAAPDANGEAIGDPYQTDYYDGGDWVDDNVDPQLLDETPTSSTEHSTEADVERRAHSRKEDAGGAERAVPEKTQVNSRKRVNALFNY
jgi:hypothetical protein